MTERSRHFFVLGLVVAIALGAASSQASASSGTTWISPTDGDFEDPANWLNEHVPSSGEEATFFAPHGPVSFTVSFNQDHENAGLVVRGVNDVIFDLNGHAYTIAGDIFLGSMDGGYWQAGDLTVTDGTLTGKIIEIGAFSDLTVLDGGSVVGLDLTVKSGGTATVADDGSITVQRYAVMDGDLLMEGGSFTSPHLQLNDGDLTGHGEVHSRIVASQQSTITADGDMTLGLYSDADGFHTDGALIVGANTVTINDRDGAGLGYHTELGDGVAGGTLRAVSQKPWQAGFGLNPGSQLVGRGTVDGGLTNEGAVIGDGTAINERIVFSALDDDWKVSGTGFFANTLIMSTYDPGNGPALVTGENQGFGGIVDIDLDAVGNDLIVDLGTVLLYDSPTLNVGSFDFDLLPDVGDEFVVMSWDSGLDGLFGDLTVNRWFKARDRNFTMRYTDLNGPGELILTTTLLGDFDLDGDVDIDDVDLLSANFGSTDTLYDIDNDGDADGTDFVLLINDLVEWSDPLTGYSGAGTHRTDFNLDGWVNGTDLAILRANYGTTGGFGQGNSMGTGFIDGLDLSTLQAYYGGSVNWLVPEPLTLGLLGVGGLILLRRRR
jgi:hypothetical protein